MGCFFGVPIDFIARILKDFRSLSRESESLSRTNPYFQALYDRISDSERIGNAQLIVNDLPVLQIL